MLLVDVTNSYHGMVKNQLSATDAQYIKVYSLGNTTVIYSEAPKHIDAILSNKIRPVNNTEIEFIVGRFFEKHREKLEVIHDKDKHVVEMTAFLK